MTHVEYLRRTLIPDLYESGRDATAEDFEECCTLIDTIEETFREIKVIAQRHPEHAYAKQIVSKCDKALDLQIQDEAVPSPDQGAEEATEEAPSGGSPVHSDARGQDESSNRLRELPRVEGVDRRGPGGRAFVDPKRVEKADPPAQS